MKPMKINMAKLKKVAGDNHSTTFQHDDGHQMKVAHAALSPLQREQLKRMPVQKLAEGTPDGPVEDPTLGMPSVTPDEPSLGTRAGKYIGSTIRDAASDTAGAVKTAAGWVYPAGFISGLTQGATGASDDQEPESDNGLPEASGNLPNQGAPVGTAQSNPSPMIPQSGVNLQRAYNQGQQAISEQQGVDTAKSKSNAETQTKDLAAREPLNKTYQATQQALIENQQKFMQDFMAGHVDPKHYVENMSSGQRVATAIGLFLGGLGSGFTHQGNPALDFLNKQIDRDIEGQKLRQDQQKTLLGANQELFHDNLLTQNQTRMNMNDIYDHKIQLAASQLGTQQAKANADAAHSHFALQNAQLLQQNAVRAAILSHLANGGSGVSAIDLQHAGFISPEEATKEQGSINAQKNAISQVNDIYSRLKTINTAGYRAQNPIQAPKEIDALHAQLTNAIMSVDASKRLTPESAKLEVEPFWSSLTDNRKTMDAKNSGVLGLIKEHSAGSTPNMEQFSPKSLPQYGKPAPQYQVGQTVYSGGRKYQIINAKGDVRPVK